jgi:hypothetical protein
VRDYLFDFLCTDVSLVSAIGQWPDFSFDLSSGPFCWRHQRLMLTGFEVRILLIRHLLFHSCVFGFASAIRVSQ